MSMATPLSITDSAKDCDPSVTSKTHNIVETVDGLADRFEVRLKEMVLRRDDDPGIPRLILDVFIESPYNQDVSEFIQALPIVVGDRIAIAYPLQPTRLFAMGHPVD